MKINIQLLICVFIIAFFSCKDSESSNDSAYSERIKNEFLNRVEPPNWWTGMKDKTLQLQVYHPEIGAFKPEINYSGVTIKEFHTAKSPNYLFIDLEISEEAKAGKFDIVFNRENDEEKTHTYELKDRVKASNAYIGFDNSDVIYLITPDRFANGDSSNDIVEGLNQATLDRSDDYGRHGGDIKGITDHINYISELGYTAVWPTPVLINDMFEGSYHGYAITDYYRVDPRFGTLEEYVNLSTQLKSKGMKLIMDQVANHCGLQHWWMKDLPFDDWVNDQANYEANKDNWTWRNYTGSNHRRTTNQDSYASESDRKGNNEGWFVPNMPDLNQRNPFMAKYIIQNSIWWIETLDLGGIRQDTYPYPDKQFMADWAGAIMNEYPNFSIVGEEWSYNPLLVGYWQTGNKNKDGYESHLKSSMDFPMQKAIIEGVMETESWDRGLVKMYEGLANDFHYVTPEDIMVFLGNHDKSRIYTEVGEDLVKAKMALGYMLALPRIPQIYYGTEILMDDTENPGDHGLIRTDFPGGWEGDAINAFTGVGLTDDQKDMQTYLKTVLNYRKTSQAIHEGETVHFAPFMGTYFLFRIFEEETVVVVLNKNETAVTIDLKRYAEIGIDGETLKNIVTGETFKWDNEISFDKKGITLLTTKL